MGTFPGKQLFNIFIFAYLLKEFDSKEFAPHVKKGFVLQKIDQAVTEAVSL